MSSYFGIPIRNGIAIGLGSLTAMGPPPGEAVNNLLAEDGSNLLQETGYQIMLES